MAFIEQYDSIKNDFINGGLFNEIKGANETISWPDSSGLYVVWKENSKHIKNLIYVGMTGKFKRENGQVIFNKACFKNRTGRWTPYRFCEARRDTKWKYFFRYGPRLRKVNEKAKIKYEDDAYSNSISYNDLIIHCFTINAEHPEYSPALLESLILTNYMKENDNGLPPANNEL